VLSINAATTNITTSGYVTLGTVSAGLIPAAIVIVNNTSSIIKLAYGPSGSETDLVAILPTFMEIIPLTRHITGGTRLALEAVDSNATTKYVVVSLIP
jgi:hypothetical protein